MGNHSSKQLAPDATSIETHYANLAERLEARNSEARNHEEVEDIKEGTANPGDNAEDARNDSNPESRSTYNQNPTLRAPNLDGQALGKMATITNSASTLEQATAHLAQAILFTSDARDRAIRALKELDVRVIVQAVHAWVRAHPWETAAIVIPLILLACTPGFLGLMGFTASGVAAGSVAAGVQAGIGGSVAAGSGFAILTSAAMGGYGVPVVFGGVWGISSAIGWGLAAWHQSHHGEAEKNEGKGLREERGEDAEENTH